MILIIIKFCELLRRISPRIINSLRSYIKHSKECFLLFPNTSKLVKKTRLRLVFPTYFSVFGNRRKHSSSCLIYYIFNTYWGCTPFSQNFRFNQLKLKCFTRNKWKFPGTNRRPSEVLHFLRSNSMEITVPFPFYGLLTS